MRIKNLPTWLILAGWLVTLVPNPGVRVAGAALAALGFVLSGAAVIRAGQFSLPMSKSGGPSKTFTKGARAAGIALGLIGAAILCWALGWVVSSQAVTMAALGIGGLAFALAPLALRPGDGPGWERYRPMVIVAGLFFGGAGLLCAGLGAVRLVMLALGR